MVASKVRSRLRTVCLGTAAAAWLLGSSPPAHASEAQLGEEPAPTEVEDVKDGFDAKGVERDAPWIARAQRALLPDFLADGQLDLHFRTYYMNHAEDSDDPLVPEHDRAAWAYGGWLRWQSP